MHFPRLSVLLLLLLLFVGCSEPPRNRILVFSKTAGYRHASIPEAHTALKGIADGLGLAYDSTEDAGMFTDEVLSQYGAVVFAQTTLDVLDEYQEAAFQRYIRDGGGFVGIHSATDTEYDWDWYGELVGGRFDGHPANPGVRPGRVVIEDPRHPATSQLRFYWDRVDEWYDIRERNPDVNVLITVIDSTYKDEWDEDRHPLSWYHEFDGGRVFYTAMGHTSESFSERPFLLHLRGGLEYALGRKGRLKGPPPETAFSREILADSLNEPMELDVLPDGRIMFVQRPGQILLFDRESDSLVPAGELEVSTEGEDGLLGLALDPGFEKNQWLYLYYATTDTSVNRLSRFEFGDDGVVPESEVVLLEVPVFRGCCHSGGSIEFDAEGNLYLSTGDDTNPFASNGHSPHDEREGREVWNALRSAANTMDLRGKVLRIKPEEDGSYSIPPGNLAGLYQIEARPEIYTMGHRNPFRISIDSRSGFLYWGEVGPDANDDTDAQGPRGYDEVGQARQAGNFGWPMFIADSKPYRLFDFETETSGDYFAADQPLNESRLNTGATTLPGAQPAMIWYPYGDSSEFPGFGNGGRTAMAGPVYYHDDYEGSDGRFPAYYDGKLFIYEWMRHWIKTVTFDKQGDLIRIEDFMRSTPFNRPMDMTFGPDGAMYLLEYGTRWEAQNPEARLSRIAYSGG